MGGLKSGSLWLTVCALLAAYHCRATGLPSDTGRSAGEDSESIILSDVGVDQLFRRQVARSAMLRRCRDLATQSFVPIHRSPAGSGRAHPLLQTRLICRKRKRPTTPERRSSDSQGDQQEYLEYSTRSSRFGRMGGGGFRPRPTPRPSAISRPHSRPLRPRFPAPAKNRAKPSQPYPKVTSAICKRNKKLSRKLKKYCQRLEGTPESRRKQLGAALSGKLKAKRKNTLIAKKHKLQEAFGRLKQAKDKLAKKSYWDKIKKLLKSGKDKLAKRLKEKLGEGAGKLPKEVKKELGLKEKTPGAGTGSTAPEGGDSPLANLIKGAIELEGLMSGGSGPDSGHGPEDSADLSNPDSPQDPVEPTDPSDGEDDPGEWDDLLKYLDDNIGESSASAKQGPDTISRNSVELVRRFNKLRTAAYL